MRALSLLCALCFVAPLYAQPPAQATACVACHGVDGKAVNPAFPHLAGQHESYLITAMKAYQTGLRKDPTMTAMMGTLSEEDIKVLAAYYAGL